MGERAVAGPVQGQAEEDASEETRGEAHRRFVLFPGSGTFLGVVGAGTDRPPDQFVIPGNIIYKQRGTLWWPGENCIMGRDHTIHAHATGYVKYYRDPSKHPDRKYIGVVFNKTDTLPYPLHAERRRKLNMAAFPIREVVPEPEMSASGIPNYITREVEGKVNGLEQGDKVLRLRKDYSYREDNWRIGRLVKTTGLQVKKFRSRRAYFRHRRWIRETMIAGEKRAIQRRQEIEAEGGSEWDALAAKVKAGAAKMGKKAKKGKKR